MIQILNVSKKFRIWEDRSRDLKETAINWLRGKKRSYRELWALRKINLEIREGETVAFIGENGSGKSTLLKLLCGIYTPDEGKIVTQGKISSLLELGVGFHPDLTGEENVYLNGAMLGFDSTEMRKRFDEIVSFSEIGDFIYSPIRTYSSGMLMRLGFSVAMCVNPDILLIDEVLAVGDEAFQKKCLERLETFKESGKTTVLVSHSLEMVQRFCERAILLREGSVVCDDVPEKTIKAYHTVLYGKESHPAMEKDLEIEKVGSKRIHPIEMSSKTIGKPSEETEEEPQEGESKEEVTPHLPRYQRHGTLEAEIMDVILHTEKGEEAHCFSSGEVLSIRLCIRFHQEVENPVVGISIMQYEGGGTIEIYSTNTLWRNVNMGNFGENTEVEVDFVQRISIPQGEYYLTVAIANTDISKFFDWHENIRSFRIMKGSNFWKGKVDLNSQIFISRSSPQNEHRPSLIRIG